MPDAGPLDRQGRPTLADQIPATATVGPYVVGRDPDPDPDGGPISWVVTDTRDGAAVSDWFTYADAIADAMERHRAERPLHATVQPGDRLKTKAGVSPTETAEVVHADPRHGGRFHLRVWIGNIAYGTWSTDCERLDERWDRA